MTPVISQLKWSRAASWSAVTCSFLLGAPHVGMGYAEMDVQRPRRQSSNERMLQADAIILIGQHHICDGCEQGAAVDDGPGADRTAIAESSARKASGLDVYKLAEGRQEIQWTPAWVYSQRSSRLECRANKWKTCCTQSGHPAPLHKRRPEPWQGFCKTTGGPVEGPGSAAPDAAEPCYAPARPEGFAGIPVKMQPS